MENNRLPVDSNVRIVSDMHVQHYGCNTGKVESLNRLGTLAIAGVQLPTGRFAWIPEHCLILEK